jgi:hypothetical protein
MHAIHHPPSRFLALRLVIAALLLLVLGVATVTTIGLFWMPHSIVYTVDASAVNSAPAMLHVVANAWPFEPGKSRESLPLSQIRSVRVTSLHGGLRVGGTALDGYCVGLYEYPDLGRVFQATDCSRQVIVLGGGELPIVVTPSDMSAFVVALRSGESATFRPARQPSVWVPLRAVPLLPLGACVLVLVLMLYGPSRIEYAVTVDAVTVRGILGTRQIPLEGLHARRYRPAQGTRLFGAALPGYYAGLFSLDGARTQVRATSVREGILLERPGTPRIFINPEESPRFLSELRDFGAKVEGGSADSG